MDELQFQFQLVRTEPAGLSAEGPRTKHIQNEVGNGDTSQVI